jgi:hypothetical protein
MNDPNIKQVQVTGAAATNSSYSGGEGSSVSESFQNQTLGGGRARTGSRKRRKLQLGGEGESDMGQGSRGATLKVSKEGGGAMSTGTIVQLTASHIPGNPVNMKSVVGANSALTQKGAPLTGGAEAPRTAAPVIQTPVKVVLAAPKKKSKVVLAAAKPQAKLNLNGGGGAASSSTSSSASATNKTRKVKSTARKIKVNMKSLSKKINRATTIRKKAAETSIEQVKKTLQKAGILKADSKAPEQILRQMYADFMTLKNRAL